ncbi:MAG: tetratricopeptide repeat protein [Phycisphaerae bacterium]|nr:tetratricopeptide repeat protein [Phycisphaerae bacterium]
MSPESEKERSIFLAALEISNRNERNAYLKEACGNDKALFTRLEALLEAENIDDGFMKSPILGSDITLEDTPDLEVPGAIIDRYKLLEKIGEGGMATVYMAQQVQPIRRKVALKIIKLGMDTRQVIARFEVERQALAMMDHPNIAKVFDAGTTETGRPYFVMELVRGVSITDYCDQNNLTTRQRLDLFIQVCNAVQHAHQKGIIHRDIKPANVMVTVQDGKPVPKVIDFGIAKATDRQLTEKTLFTQYAQMIGTPEYMSPEQAETGGVDVDTRTDIYSLGVLLYELLTEVKPFDAETLRKAGYAEIQRIIREEEPDKPSTRLSTLGDSLTGIARHRQTEPNTLRKLLRGDLDWIVMKSLEKDRSRRYETVNELEMDINRHLASEPVMAAAPGITYRLRKFTRRNRVAVAFGCLVAIMTIVVISALSVSTVMIWREKGRTEAQAKRAEGNFLMALNTVDEMLKLVKLPIRPGWRWKFVQESQNTMEHEELCQTILQKTQKLYEEFLEKNSDNPAALIQTADAFFRIVLSHKYLGQDNQAVQQIYQKALIAGIRAIELKPEDSNCWRIRGQAYNGLGQYDKAVADFTKAVELKSDDNLYWLRGDAYYSLGQYDKAFADFTKSIELNPKNSYYWRGRGVNYRSLGQYDKALADFSKAIELNPNDAGHWYAQGLAHRSIGQIDKAIADFTKAIELQPDFVFPWIERGKEYLNLRQYDKALIDFTKAIELNLNAAWPRFERGKAYLDLDQYDKALTDFTKAIELKSDFEWSWYMRGKAYLGLGQYDKAFADLDKFTGIAKEPLKIPKAFNYLAWKCVISPDIPLPKASFAVKLAEKTVQADPNEANYWNTLGVAHYRAGQWEEASTALKKTMELSKGEYDGCNLFFIAMARWQLGEKTKAHQVYGQAVEWMKQKQPDNDQLAQFRAEAAKLLGITKPKDRKEVTPGKE